MFVVLAASFLRLPTNYIHRWWRGIRWNGILENERSDRISDIGCWMDISDYDAVDGIDTEEMDELLLELHLVASFMREVRRNTKREKLKQVLHP